MTTQTIQFESVSLSEVGSGTLTAFIYSGATLTATLASITENSTLKGRYTGTVADIAAGSYRLVVKFNGITVSEPNDAVTLLLAVGTYVATRAAVLDSSARVKLDSSQPDYAPATAAALAAIASTGTVNILSRVSGSTITTFMGDDHKVRSGTQIPISVSDPSGTLHAKWAVIGISNLAFGASRAGHPAGEIVGTIASISYSANVTTVSIEISACGANLKPAEYTYQIQSTQTHTGEYDDTIEVAGLLRLERRTVAAVG